MYEVLIAHLRGCAKLDASNNTYAEAANAIEELSKRVPKAPHGRLIDADALRAEVKKHATPSDAWVFSLIRTAPTVIEADEVLGGLK